MAGNRTSIGERRAPERNGRSNLRNDVRKVP